jgi:hypothetical protein
MKTIEIFAIIWGAMLAVQFLTYPIAVAVTKTVQAVGLFFGPKNTGIIPSGAPELSLTEVNNLSSKSHPSK